MAYGDIVEYGGEQYRDITPNMTSNTTPAPYYANANGEHIYNDQTKRGHAFCAFSDPQNGATQETWGWSPSSPPNWIGIGMGRPVMVDLIKIITNRKIQKIILYGSNDKEATLEEILAFTSDTRTGVLEGKLGTCLVLLPGGKEYSYYRLHTTSVNPSGWSGFSAIRFYQKMTDEKYLISDNGHLKTIINGTLTALETMEPTQAVFAQHGFANLADIATVNLQLNSRFKVLRYDSANPNTAIAINHLPEPQLIMPVADIDVSAYSSIKQITLTTTGTTGVAKVIFSFDGGITWNTFSGGVWVTIEPVASTVITDGITPEHVALIPSEQWATVITNKLRIAYCLSKSAVTDDIAVDTLSITGDTESWKKAQRTVDYNCQLPNTGTMIIELLQNGSYKINYMES